MDTTQNTPDDLLHAYIDDELDPELEQQLFATLAADVDMRSRFRQLRGLRAEARRFGAVADPPQELTVAVFDRLGFASVSSVRPSHLVGAALLFRNAWAPVASAAAAAILTATLIFGLQGSPSGQDTPVLADRQSSVKSTHQTNEEATPKRETAPSVREAVPTSRQATASEREAAPFQIPGSVNPSISRTRSTQSAAAQNPGSELTSVFDATNPASESSAAATDSEVDAMELPAVVMNTAPATVPKSVQHGEADAVEHAVPNSEQGDARTSGESFDPSSSHAPSVLAQQGIPAVDLVDTRRYFPSLDAGPGFHSISVELRGVSAASFPNATIGTRSNPWMENMAVAVYYSEEQDDFGLEYGQEPFSQHYSGVENGKAVRYEQNLLASWILAGYRHRFAPWRSLGSIEPYIATSLGSTFEAWPLARASMGVMYMPDRRVRFHLGLEGSMLAYPYQDKWFNSKRAGLTYGISILL